MIQTGQLCSIPAGRDLLSGASVNRVPAGHGVPHGIRQPRVSQNFITNHWNNPNVVRFLNQKQEWSLSVYLRTLLWMSVLLDLYHFDVYNFLTSCRYARFPTLPYLTQRLGQKKLVCLHPFCRRCFTRSKRLRKLESLSSIKGTLQGDLMKRWKLMSWPSDNICASLNVEYQSTITLADMQGSFYILGIGKFTNH